MWDEGELKPEQVQSLVDMDRLEIMRMEGDMLRFRQGQLVERVEVLEHLADSMIDDDELSRVVGSLDPDGDGMLGERDFGDKFLATGFLAEGRRTKVYFERDAIEEREVQLEQVGRSLTGHPWLLWLACKDQVGLDKAKKCIANKSWRNTATWLDEDGCNEDLDRKEGHVAGRR